MQKLISYCVGIFTMHGRTKVNVQSRAIWTAMSMTMMKTFWLMRVTLENGILVIIVFDSKSGNKFVLGYVKEKKNFNLLLVLFLTSRMNFS
jgi:hypothetical protein